MGKRWNEQDSIWEVRESGTKIWKTMPRYEEVCKSTGRAPVQQLAEETFSQVLMKLATPNYTRKLLTDAELDVEIEFKTLGASDLRTQESFNERDSPVVYQVFRKVMVNGKKTRIQTVMKRTINKTRPNNLYATFIHKAFYKTHPESIVEQTMKQFKDALKEHGLWDRAGWSEEEPPQKSSGKQLYDLEAFIKMLEEKFQGEELRGKTAK